MFIILLCWVWQPQLLFSFFSFSFWTSLFMAFCYSKSHSQPQVKAAKAHWGWSNLNLARWHISALMLVSIFVSTDVWVFKKHHLARPPKRGLWSKAEAGFGISDGGPDLWQSPTQCQGSSSGMGSAQCTTRWLSCSRMRLSYWLD